MGTTCTWSQSLPLAPKNEEKRRFKAILTDLLSCLNKSDGFGPFPRRYHFHGAMRSGLSVQAGSVHISYMLFICFCSYSVRAQVAARANLILATPQPGREEALGRNPGLIHQAPKLVLGSTSPIRFFEGVGVKKRLLAGDLLDSKLGRNLSLSPIGQGDASVPVA